MAEVATPTEMAPTSNEAQPQTKRPAGGLSLCLFITSHICLLAHLFQLVQRWPVDPTTGAIVAVALH